MRKIGFIHAASCLLVLFIASCNAPPAISEDVMEKSSSAHLIIRFNVKSDRLGDFLPIMEGVSSDMASENGFVAARVYRDVDDPLSFTLIEEWASRDDHQEHFKAINGSGDWDNILGMLTRDPDMSYNDIL